MNTAGGRGYEKVSGGESGGASRYHSRFEALELSPLVDHSLADLPFNQAVNEERQIDDKD